VDCAAKEDRDREQIVGKVVGTPAINFYLSNTKAELLVKSGHPFRHSVLPSSR
jgi:hypothetical protein